MESAAPAPPAASTAPAPSKRPGTRPQRSGPRARSWARTGRAVALLGAGALALAACGSSSTSSSAAASSASAGAPPASSASAPAKPVSFVLWESHNGGPVGAAMSALVAKFNASQKAVHVTIDVTKASKKLLAATAAGDPPVLAEISHYDGTYLKGKALQSWNSLIARSTELSQSNLLPAVWRNGEVGGQHYRLQADVKLSIVSYNKTLFTKAGISAPPTTWTQLASDAAKLKAIGVTPIGWKDSSAHILPALLSNGGSMLKGSNSVGTAVDFNTPAGQATFSYFHDLYAQGDLILGHGTTLREDLAAGKVAMIDGTSAGYQKTLDAVAGKFPVGVFVEPAGSTGKAYNVDQGLGFVLPKADSHAQAEAALAFVEFWFAPAQQAYWAEHTGFAPETRAGIAAIPASFLATHPGLVATIKAVTSSDTFPRPVSDRYKEVQSALDATFQQVTTGKVSVSAGLAALDKTGDSYMSGASAL